jgi:PAS domain S-box-containing protein
VIGVAVDVTDLKQREEELREERAFIESLFDAIPDVLYAFDQERTMLRWNDQLSTLTGYSDAEIAEMAPLDFVADEDMEILRETSSQVFGEGAVATHQVDLVTKAGKHVPMELTAAPDRGRKRRYWKALSAFSIRSGSDTKLSVWRGLAIFWNQWGAIRGQETEEESVGNLGSSEPDPGSG